MAAGRIDGKGCEEEGGSGIMRNIRTAFLALLWSIGTQHAGSQESLSISGYVMEFGAFTRTNETLAAFARADRAQWTSITRVRLRPLWQPWDSGELTLEYEAFAQFQSAVSFIQPTSGGSRRQVFNLTSRSSVGDHWSMRQFIDRLHYRQSLDGIDITLGRQRIAWGSGRIWNPTDLFNPLNPAVISKIEKDGVDAMLVKASFGNFTDLSIVCNPQRGWDGFNSGFRFRTNMEGFDFSAMGGRFDERGVVGMDVAGSLLDAGIRAEGIYSWDPTNRDGAFTSWILGTDYQFTADAYAMIEYHWNGEGSSDRSRYDLQRFVSGDILSLGQEYVAAQASYLVHPLVTLNAMTMRNLNDGSGFVNASVQYSASDEIAVVVGIQAFDGSSGSEYWWYPDVVYLRADLWF
jgi:hypothetical protein